MTTTVATTREWAALAVAREALCIADHASVVVRAPHRITIGRMPVAYVTDARTVIAIAMEASLLRYTPERLIPLMTALIDPPLPAVRARWDDVDDQAFRDWLGEFEEPLDVWDMRVGRIGGELFDRNCIAAALELVWGPVLRVWQWHHAEIATHLVTLFGDGWRITVAGVRQLPQYIDAPEWGDVAR